MNNTKTYNDYLARLDTLKEEMLGIKRDPTEEERKIEAEYAVAFKDMLHTGMPQKALRRGSAPAILLLNSSTLSGCILSVSEPIKSANRLKSRLVGNVSRIGANTTSSTMPFIANKTMKRSANTRATRTRILRISSRCSPKVISASSFIGR